MWGVIQAQNTTLPVQLSDENNKHPYVVKNVRNPNYYVAINPTAGVRQGLKSSNQFTGDKSLAEFIFEKAGNAEDELTIKVKIGEQYYPVTVEGENLNDGAIVKAVETNTANTVWKIVTKDANYVFNFKTNNGNWVESSWNMYGGAGNDIKTYQATDNGSTWTFETLIQNKYNTLLSRASKMYHTAIDIWSKGAANDNRLKEALVEKEAPTEEDYNNLKSALDAYINAPVEHMNDITTTFQNKMHSTYMQVGEGQFAKNLVLESQTNLKSIWEIKPAGGNTAKLYNPTTRYYIAKMNNNGSEIGTNTRLNMTADENQAAVYTFDLNEQPDGKFYFSASDNSWTTDDKNSLHGTDWKAVVRWGKAADASQWTIGKQVTYKYYIDDQEVGYSVVTQRIGSRIEQPRQLSFANVSYPQGEDNVTATTNEVRVDVKETLPFKKTTDLSQPVWQTIAMHNVADAWMWHYEADATDIKTIAPANKYNAHSILTDDAYFWCLKGNVLEGFEIYNKKAGVEKSLNTTTDKVQITTNGTHTKWQAVAPTQTSIPNAVCFKANGTQFLNHTAENLVGYHNQADEGSSCRFYSPASFALNKADNIVSIPTNAVGGYENDAEIEPALKNAEAAPYDFDLALALSTAITSLKPNGKQVTAGKYYLIKKANQNFYAGYKDAETPFCKESSVNTKREVELLWLAEAAETTEGGFYLKNANMQAYLGQAADAPQKTPFATDKQQAGVYHFLNKGDAQFEIAENGTKALQREEGGNTLNSLNYWSAAPAARKQWYIIEATDIEVALNAHEGKSYATAYLPFDIASVEGAKAYIGQKNETGDKLNATVLEGGIPAKRGVILMSETAEPKATLKLGQASATVTNNALTGTLTEKDYTDELVFGLGNTSGKVGFYKMAAGAKILANKAYLAAGAQQALELVFEDGTTTGIENVTNEAAKRQAPIYDLTGRRIMQTVKGGLYIQNGKKFIAQ